MNTRTTIVVTVFIVLVIELAALFIYWFGFRKPPGEEVPPPTIQETAEAYRAACPDQTCNCRDSASLEDITKVIVEVCPNVSIDDFAKVVAIKACPEAPDCICGPTVTPDTQVVVTIPPGNVLIGIRFAGTVANWLPGGIFSLTQVRDTDGNVAETVASASFDGPQVLQLKVPPDVQLLTFEVGEHKFVVPQQLAQP